MKKIVFSFLLFLFTFDLQAKQFRNSYISFELPSKWTCNRENTEYVCISEYAGKKKEATIIFTAKEAGPTDGLNYYLNYLKNPIPSPNSKGEPTRSVVKNVSERRINSHIWVDSLHLGSEVSSYFTRYLATVKDRLGILVTFSAHKSHYTKYASDFIRAIQSLTVVAPKNLKSSTQLPNVNQTNTIGPSTIGPGLGALDPSDDMEMFKAKKSSKKDLYYKILGIFLLVSSIALYIYAKKK